MTSRIGQGIAGAILGALPGVILVLLAQFVIEGELQLTIGAPGIILAVAGALVGGVVGWRRHRAAGPG